MLSIVRCCTRFAPRLTPSIGSGVQCYRAVPKIQTSTSAAWLRKCQTQLVQVKGLSQRIGTLSVGFASKSLPKSQKVVGSWLFTCSGMVFVAVSLGTAGYAIFYFYVRRAVKVVVDETWGK